MPADLSKGLLILAALLLTGCNAGGQWQPPPPIPAEQNKPYALSKADTSVVESTIRNKMKDPDSTQFRGIQAVVKPDGAIRVCGEVNSKNSFGGYTGFTPFAGNLLGQGFQILFFSDEDDIQKFTRSSCRISGINL